MATKSPPYVTRELSPETWPDFARLFSRGNGWDFCWCMHFHRCRTSRENKRLRTRAEKSAQNRRDKRARVESGTTHGILVYAEGVPVGWCQYGRSAELPRIDESPHYRARCRKSGACNLWRITCFVVDKRYRKQGIARVALRAALESIQAQGGGIVEAYPLLPWESLCRSELRRRGRTPAFGNVSTHGTSSIFEQEGFKAIAPFGHLNVLMRRTV
jgi:ribosomal protein S18 acetylase RimI-like enzyme